MRHLATIQQIIDIKPIQGADKIDLCTVLGWNIIIKKNEFNVGDKVVYIEIDSILPDKPEFEFLRQRKFIIKTYKLNKFNVISQGIVFPLSILPEGNYDIDQDVTEILGIKKHDSQLVEELQEQIDKNSKNPIVKYLLRYKFFRDLMKINKKKGGFPEWLPKTDEERIQGCPRLLEYHKDRIFYVSEKLDGQSGSFAVVWHKKFLFFKQPEFFVCSRNIRQKTPTNSNYWTIAVKYDIENKIKRLKRNLAIQGEIVGPRIQKNKYNLADLDFYIFSVYDIDKARYVDYNELMEVVNKLNLKTVPILDTNFKLKETVNDMVEYAKGESTLYKTLREGAVIRAIDDSRISFKVINNEFLIKHGE
jgi:hypothetical protein